MVIHMYIGIFSLYGVDIRPVY